MPEFFPHAMPLAGFIGGLMIGVAAAIMLLGNGRIAGVSGMFARVLGRGVPIPDRDLPRRRRFQTGNVAQ